MKARLMSLFLIALLSCTSPLVRFSEAEHVVEVYEDVIGSRDQLYVKAASWMIALFNDPESVVQLTDKTEGVVIGKYLLHGHVETTSNTTTDTRVYAVIEIRLRDNKARIKISPQETWSYDASARVKVYSKQDAQREMLALANSFHHALLNEDVEF